MRSVEARFRVFSQASPGHSSLIVFGRTIQGQNFTRRIIAVHFNKLVAKDDYTKNDKKRILSHFYKLVVDGKKQGVVGGQERTLTPSPYQRALKHK